MQGPLQQQISSKSLYGQSSSSNSKLSNSQTTQTYSSGGWSQISTKQSPIEQQILELKCIKIALNDQPILINFINKVIHLISEALANFKPKYMTEIVNLLLAKMTLVNYTTSMSWDEKAQQIAKWSYYQLPGTASQLCGSIASYIVQQADLSNFLQALTLLYFLLFFRFELENKTLLAISWSIHKFINSVNPINFKSSIGFIKDLALRIINIINSKANCNTNMLKVYANCCVLLLKFISSQQQVEKLQTHLMNNCLTEQIIMNSLPENSGAYIDEKQDYFISACEVYAITGNRKLLRIIKLFIENGVTITMLSNFWNLLNADHNLGIFSRDCLKRISQILNYIKNKCNQSIKYCHMSAKGTWVSRVLDRKVSLVIFKFGLSHPRESYSTENQLILRLQMEVGMIEFYAKIEKADSKAFSLWIKKYTRHSDENSQQKQQYFITNGLEPCISTLIIEFKPEKKLVICSETSRLNQINHASMGRPKNIFIGVRKQENQFECILRKIFAFVTLEDTTFDQYLKQKQSKPAETQNDEPRTALKRSLSENIPKSVQKFDLFESIEVSKEAPPEKIKTLNKSLIVQNIKVLSNNDYGKMMPRLGVKQKLPSYILNALEAVKNDQILKDFISLLRKQWKVFELTDDDFYELSFLHGHSLFLKKPNSLINELIQFIPTSKSKLSKLTEKKAKQNQRMLLLKLQLLLKTSLQIDNQNNQIVSLKESCIELVEQYLMCNQRNTKQDEQSLVKLSSFLNTVMRGCINDYTLQDQLMMAITTRKKQLISNMVINAEGEKARSFQISALDPENIDKFAGIIYQCLKTVLERVQSDYLVIENVALCLQALSVILCHMNLRERSFQPELILPILKYFSQTLQFLSGLLAKVKIVPELDQNKICVYLSQMYNLLPVLLSYCKVFNGKIYNQSNLKQFYEETYTAASRNKILKQEPFFVQMCEYYRVCFSIGSFCLKDRKSGFLSYMAHAYRFLTTYKDNMSWDEDSSVLTYTDRITITEIYAWCFYFAVRSNQHYTFDVETQIQIIQKLNELCLPIYHIQINGRSLIKRILSFFVQLCLPENYPTNLLANLEEEEAQKIFVSINKQLSSPKIEEKANQIIYLLNLVNFYPKYVSLTVDLTPYQKLGIKYGELKKIYFWTQAFSLIKRVYNFLKQNSSQQNKADRKKYPQKISQTLNKIYKLLMENFKDDSNFTNLNYLMKNFIGDEKDSSEENLEHFLPFVEVLLNQFEKINGNLSVYFEKAKKEKKKENEVFIITTKDQNLYFCTDRVQGALKQDKTIKIQQISKKVSTKIFASHAQYFTQVYSKIAQDKNRALVAYYKMIEKLSFEEKLYNTESSEKYKFYDYYILDDYLNKSNTKVMLKRDPVSILGNLVSGQIPRLYEQKQVLSHTLYALKIAKFIRDLNQNPFFQINLEPELRLNQEKTKNQKGRATISAVLVTKSKLYQGKIQINENSIIFSENMVIDQLLYQKLLANKSEQRTLQQISVARKTVFIDKMESGHCMKKNYLQSFPALEVYSGRLSYFFVFLDNDDRKKFQDNSEIYFPQEFQKTEMVNELVQKWRCGWIDNFNFLIKINNLSGRSFNDVSQYYVFPWTVTNFHDVMDSEFLKRKQNFRDLTKPIGSLNPVKLRNIVEKYQNFSHNEQNFKDKPYMYGSFYSNPGVVCNYLLRVNPFTIHHYQLQGNQFDLYDRLFTNMQDQIESIFQSIMDNRELVPQFYCAPEFFRNRNRYNFAHSQPQENKCDLTMRMPKWVITRSPEQFVFRMRKGLQTNLISSQLGSWIDLIFGFKSEEENAAQHKNLYMHQLYRSKGKKQGKSQELIQSQNDKSSMIKLFGQVPRNIFGSKTSVKPMQPTQATSIYNRNIEIKKLKLGQVSKNKGKTNFLFHFRDSILVISDENDLLILSENEEMNKLKTSIDEPFLSMSLLNFKKNNFFLLFAIDVEGELHLYKVKMHKGNLLKKSQFKIQSTKSLFRGCKFTQVQTLQKYVIIIQHSSARVLEVSKEKNSSTIENLSENYYLNDKGYISLHRAPITNLQTYQKLQIIISIDTSGLVNVFNVHPQLSIRSTFTLSSTLKISQKIIKILTHQMGIIVLLTSFNQIIVCNIYGDLIQRFYIQQKDVVDMVLWDDEASSEVLISTKFGLIYQLDLFDILQNGEECLLGLNVKIGHRKSVEAQQKCGNKLAINRFGRFWELYIISSLDSITVIQCEQFLKNYQAKIFKHNCNHNNSYKNT